MLTPIAKGPLASPDNVGPHVMPSEMRPTEPLTTSQFEPETPEYVEQIDAQPHKPLIKQGLLHYCGHIATILSGILLVPLMLHRLGVEAYGLWIVALAVPNLTSGVDNTLYLSVARETGVHQTSGRISDQATTSFLSACCGAYVVFGALVGILMVLCESGIVRKLHLTAPLLAAAPATFLAVAVGFVTGRAVRFGNAVLSGLQRFGRINALAVAALVVRFSGFAILLKLHPTLKAIAGWYALVSILECATMIVTLLRLGALAANRSLFRWSLLLRTGDFAAATLVSSILQNLYWSSPPILLGFFRGVGSTITLYTGQRPGFMISDFTWRGAEVVFSAAAGEDSDSAASGNRKLIVFGTKCFLAVAMPLCIGLLILAPVVIQIWLRTPRPEMATVMRWTSLGIIADALWVAPLHALWGSGRVRQVLWLTAQVAALILILNVALVPRFGATGSAVAFVIATWWGAIATLIVLAREGQLSVIGFFRESFSEVAIPSLALAIFVLSVWKALQAHQWQLVVTAVLGGGIVYAGLYLALLRSQNSVANPIQFWLKRIRG